MAITREKRQVFTQPIGVIRADASDSTVGEAISRSAATIANLAFRDAAIEAEKTGMQAGGAPARTDIVTIDPTTGRPVAYQPPSNFGRVAARAYQNMIDRRFEESINIELEERGMEIANDASSASDYRDRMSAYAQEMYANAVDENGQLNNYGRYIEETSTGYIASTYEAMRQREIQAAREALIRQQNLSNIDAMRRIPELIASGAPSEQVHEFIASEQARLRELVAEGGISLSSYSSRLDDLDGYASQVADNRLITLYPTLTEEMQSRFRAALRDPAMVPALERDLNMPNLGSVMVQAKLHGSVDTLISALENQATYMGEIQEDEVDVLTRGHTVNPNGSIEDIRAYTNTLDPQYRTQVEDELVGIWVSQNLNLAAMDENDIDRLVNELLTVGEYDFDDVAAIAGPQVAQAVEGLTQDGRNSLGNQLNTRRASLNAITSQDLSERVDALRGLTITSSTNGTIVEDASSIRAQILSADIGNDVRNALLRNLDEAVVDQSIINARRIVGISHDRMVDLRSAVQSGGDAEESFLATATDNERRIFEEYRRAYEIEPSTANARMDDRVSSLNTFAENQLQETVINGHLSAVQSGFGLGATALQELDDYYTDGNPPRNPSELANFPEILDLANRGYALPSFVRAIQNGLRSRDEADVTAAVQLFEQYTNLAGDVEGGGTQTIDILRSELPEDTYGMLAAISYVARDEQMQPLEVMLEFKAFGENPDAMILSDLALPANGSLRNVITQSGFVMSSNYEQEIMALMRIRKVRGENFNEDTVKNIINEYTERRGITGQDDAVMGPYIDDQTVYARSNYIPRDQIVSNREQLFDAMMEIPGFRDVLVGGTSLDALSSGIANTLGFNIPLGFEVAFEAAFPRMFGVDASEEYSDRERLMAGLQVAGFDLKYMPVIESFNAGRAAYQVGYEQNGRFQPIEINGEPYMLIQEEGQYSSFQTQQARNNYLAAARGGATPEQLRQLEFDYLRTREHMTDELLRENGFGDFLDAD
jgi:hypothetical protein